MGRPKGSKNKAKNNQLDNPLNGIVNALKALGVTSNDLKDTYKKGKKFLDSDLLALFEDRKAAIQKMVVTVKRGRTAGSVRPLNQDEIIVKFAQILAQEVGKAAPVDIIMNNLKEHISDRELKF